MEKWTAPCAAEDVIILSGKASSSGAEICMGVLDVEAVAVTCDSEEALS